MPILNAEQTAALNGPGPRPWVCSIVLPFGAIDGTQTWYVSKMGFAARHVGAGLGAQYKPRVVGYRYPRYVVSDSGGSLASVEMSIEIDDSSRELVAITEGEFARQVRGGAVTVREADETLSPISYFPIFTGIISSIEWEGTKAIVNCRVDDDLLQHKCPKPYTRIVVDSFPKADPANWNSIAQIVYGEHDSAGYTDEGFVPLISVDREAYLYIVSLGRCLDVTAVFLDGTRLTETTHYTWQYTARRGTWYTTVSVLAAGYEAVYGAAWSGGSAAEKLALSNGARLSADVLGLCTDSLGASAAFPDLIVDPADQIVHYLSNFCFGSWRRGPWLSTSSRITSHIGNFFLDRGYRGAHVIRTAETGTTQITSWLRSLEAVAWWGPDGDLHLGIDDFASGDVYPSGPISYQENLRLPHPEDRQRISKTTFSFVKNEAGGSYHASVNVQDPDAINDAADTINQEWGSAS